MIDTITANCCKYSAYDNLETAKEEAFYALAELKNRINFIEASK
jgi:hypothetical protein